MFIKNALVLSVLCLLLGFSSGAKAETPDVGQKAPQVTLSTPDGHPVKLQDLTAKGNVV
jgi:hypothetical protein